MRSGAEHHREGQGGRPNNGAVLSPLGSMIGRVARAAGACRRASRPGAGPREIGMAAHFPARLRAASVFLAFLLLAAVLGTVAVLVGATAQRTPAASELPFAPPPVQVNALSQPPECG